MFLTLDLGLVALVVMALSGLRVAQEYERAVVFRLGRLISEVGAENNSTTVLMIPSDFVLLAHTLNDYLRQQATSKSAAVETS